MDIRPIEEVRHAGTSIAPPVARAAGIIVPGRALDLACGTGRNAIWLSRHGWNVTAVDRDVAAIEWIKRSEPRIDARVADLEQGQFAIEHDAWDLIVCWLFLWRDLFTAIRAGVRPGGIAALCVLVSGRFGAHPDEPLRYFPDWTVLHHATGKRSTELVVQRPA